MAKRPTIKRRDLELRVAEAGREAVLNTGKLPADPKAIAALARAGKPDIIGGIEVHQPALNSLVAWEQWLASEAAAKATPVTMLASTAFAYLRPDEAITAMNAGPEVMAAAVTEFSRNLDVPTLKKITEIIRSHIHDLFGEPDQAADDAKKNAMPRPPKPSPTGSRK